MHKKPLGGGGGAQSAPHSGLDRVKENGSSFTKRLKRSGLSIVGSSCSSGRSSSSSRSSSGSSSGKGSESKL